MRPKFQSIASNFEINFCLTSIDPHGNSTNGQKTRVLTALKSTVGYRNNLWSSTNLIAVGFQSIIAVQPEIIQDRRLL